MNTQVKITWQAFGNKPERNRFISSVEFSLDSSAVSDEQLMDMIYRDTNLYAGPIWNAIEKLLPENRTHTSLSIGDTIQINEIVYIVSDFGFIKKENAEIQMFGDAIFSVTEKVGA